MAALIASIIWNIMWHILPTATHHCSIHASTGQADVRPHPKVPQMGFGHADYLLSCGRCLGKNLFSAYHAALTEINTSQDTKPKHIWKSQITVCDGQLLTRTPWTLFQMASKFIDGIQAWISKNCIQSSAFGPPQDSNHAMDNVHFDQITSVNLHASPLHADNARELIPWFDRKIGRANSCTMDA